MDISAFVQASALLRRLGGRACELRFHQDEHAVILTLGQRHLCWIWCEDEQNVRECERFRRFPNRSGFRLISELRNGWICSSGADISREQLDSRRSQVRRLEDQLA